MESSEILLYCHSHQTQGKLTTEGANDGKSDPEPFAWDWQKLIYLLSFNHEWILHIFGEILCSSDLFKYNDIWNVHTLPVLLN